MARYDVIVIGGGPAGSAAAILLAGAGHDVLLLERHRFPRHKLCGEFLSPETCQMFVHLGVLDRIIAAGPARIVAARLTAPGGRHLELALPAPAIGLSRYRLDHLLLERARAAGVSVREGTPAGTIEGSLEAGFGVTTRKERLEARVVLGAWGKRSTLDRALDRPFFNRQAGFIALKAHFRGPDPGTRTELHAFPGGYCGINRVEGNAVNVCLLADQGAWARSGKDVDALWTLAQQENGALAARLANAERLTADIVISNISFARKAAVEQGILMLGDSAELISPLVGNGQAMAIRSALLAAPLVDDFLRDHREAAALRGAYRAGWRRLFRERLFLGRLLQPLFLHPRLLAIGLRAIAAAPGLGRWLVEGTREQPADVAGYELEAEDRR